MLWRRALWNRGHHQIDMLCVRCLKPIPLNRRSVWYCTVDCESKVGAELTVNSRKVARKVRAERKKAKAQR